MSAKKQERRRLSEHELFIIKNNLLERKRQIWNEINDDIEEDVREEHQDLIQAAKDGGDHGLAELRQSTVYSLIEIKVKELGSIEEALQRIEAGKYGRCRDCSRWIKPARLEVQPFAVRCRSCQAKREK
jgi:DnaK suppressor protein